MSDFIPAPAGLTARFTDGVTLPIIAFRIADHDLIPYYVSEDGSSGQITGNCEVTADWIEGR